MKTVAKYNTSKAVSTVLSVGTPLITLACCGDFFIHRSETAISAAGIFAILIAMLFFKDKIAEKFKSPSALVVSIIVLVLILLVENILYPVKCVCIATIAACGVDELTFKNWYKKIEKGLPEDSDTYKHFGFIFATTKTVMGEEEKK
jgi:hypothetical protein